MADRLIEVIGAGPGRAGGDLLKAVLIQQLVALDGAAATGMVVTVVLKITVEPVGLQHVLGHIPKEQLLVFPNVIRPDPGTGAVLLALAAKEIKIVPPKVSVAHHDHFICLLQVRHLLVAAQVEEARMVKHLTDLADHVGAELIISGGGDHAAILLHPGIVAGGEVELRNGLDAESAHFV